MDTHTLQALPPSRTLPSYSPPSRTPIFGWLLRAKSSIGSCLRPRPHQSIFMFFVIPFSRPKQWYVAPPHDPTWSCLLFNVPSIAAADSHLIVMSCRLKAAATQGQDPPSSLFFYGACVGTQNKETSSSVA